MFYNDTNKEINTNLLDEELKHSSSSETEFFDSINSLHGNFDEKHNVSNKKDDGSTVLTACLENQVNSDVENTSLTNHTSVFSCFGTTFRENTGNETQKIEENVYEHVDKNNTTEVSEMLFDEKKDIVGKDDLHLLYIAKDVSTFSNFVRDLIDKKAEKMEDQLNFVGAEGNVQNKENIGNANKPPERPKRSEKFEDALCQDFNFTTDKFVKDTLEKSPKLDARGGKYNKKAAPPPPPSSDQSVPIKATLVLQPGVVKNCLPEGDNNCKEIFIHSPKAKRRSLVKRSHSSLSSNSASSSRTKHSLSKLIKFPKMIGFWNKDDPCEKKSSWQSFVKQDFLKPSLSDSKLQSKSENNLSKTDESVNVSLHGTNFPKSGSLISIKSLTESPLSHRRLKIIRRFVDDDID